MNFTDLKVGQKARVIAFRSGDKSYRQRLASLGILPGTDFIVSRMAPLGDPIEITVRGFALSLRKGEAQMLQIEEI